MQDNKQMYPSEKNLEKIENLFENETFMRYSPLFYESPKTVSEVSSVITYTDSKGKVRHLSRKTIYDHLGSFLFGDDYDPSYIEMKVKGRTADKPLLFTHKIVIDLMRYFAKEKHPDFSLTQDEERILLELMNLPGIDTCLRKGSKEWLVVLGKLITILVAVPEMIKEIKKESPIPQKFPRVRKLSAFEYLTQDEINALQQDLLRFVRNNKGSKDLAEKLCNLEIPLLITPRDISTLTKDGVEIGKFVAGAFLRDPRIKRIMKSKDSGRRLLAEFGYEV